MVPLGRLRTDGPRPEALAVVVANLFPFVGVVALEWTVDALVVLYWFELGVLCFWALVRAAFAGRPSEFDGDPLIAGALASKSTGIPIPRTDLRIRLTTLPVLLVAVPLLGFLWFFAGVVTVGVVSAESLEPELLTTVALAVLGIFVSEGATTALEYVYRRGYRGHSAQTAIQGVFWRSGVICLGGVAALVLITIAREANGVDDPITAGDPSVLGPIVLVGIVLVKFGFDLAGLYRDRLVAFDESTRTTIGWAYDPPTDDRVDTALSAAERRLRPARAGRLVGGLSHARRHGGVAVWILGFLLALVAVPFALGGVWTVAIALAAASVVAPLSAVSVDYWLRYAGVEYRVDGDAIVAYDRLFRTPLWRVEAWDESGLRVERDRVDEVLGTSTIVIELPDRDLWLPRLRAVDPILEVFDRRPDGFELERVGSDRATGSRSRRKRP